MAPVNLVLVEFCSKRDRLRQHFGLSRMKVILSRSIGVLNQSKHPMMHRRLQNMCGWLSTARRNTGLGSPSKDLLSIQIFCLRFIISILQFGKLILKGMRNQFSNRWIHRVLTILVVPSHQLDRVSYLSRKQMESMCGTLLTLRISLVLSSTSRLVHSCISNSNTTNIQTTGSICLTAIKIAVPYSSMRCHLTSGTANLEKRKLSRSSGTKKSRNVTSS